MNPRKMPLANLSPVEYKRLRERLYYRRVYRAKKIETVKQWKLKNPLKVAGYTLTQRSKLK